MANWRQAGEGKWTKVENGIRLVVSQTGLGDYRSEYQNYRGSLYQIGYYRKREDAQKQCENKAFGREVTVGRRQS